MVQVAPNRGAAALPTAAAPQRPAESQASTAEAALNARRTAGQARTLHALARTGLSAPAGPYPHSARIRAAFGAYAPAGLTAHMGPAARAAGRALSADAYILSGRAVFADRPSLHTAAHEAAHMVHQAHGGPALAHGVGHWRDPHERMADRIADRVAAGGTAEPLLAAMVAPPGPTAAPSPAPGAAMLQMNNTISSHVGGSKPTPWAEIQSQLKLGAGYDIDSVVTGLNPGRFGPMVATLGNSCVRAEEVTATLDGKRTGGVRKSDATQSAYGALGSFEEYLTDTPTAPKYEFEGGHLISDEILGTASYVQANFAPQRGHINAPIYRKIEEIAAGGLVQKSGNKKATPNWTLKAWVTYPAATHQISTAKIQARLGIHDSNILATPKPTHVTLTTRVPSRWQAKASVADSDFVFARESSIDKSDGAYAGFMTDEASVLKEEPKTDQYLDSNYWAMDTLKNASMNRPGTLGTGQASSHTFTAVQSVPRGQTAYLNKGVTSLPQPPPLVAPTLSKVRPITDVVGVTYAKQKLLARKILKENPKLVLTVGSLEEAFRLITQGYQKRLQKKRFSRLDYMKMKIAGARRGKGRRKGVKKPATARKGNTAQYNSSLARLIVMQQFSYPKNSMDFSV
jgi:hypothetical protein